MSGVIPVLVVGEAMIELSSRGEDLLSWTFAGDTLNCAAAIAASLPAAQVIYLTGVGDDPISTEFIDFCGRLGIHAGDSPSVPGHNLGLYWITTENGERTFRYWRNDSAARHVLRGGVTIPAQTDWAAVVLSNITLAVAGPASRALLRRLSAARNTGSLIGFDMNYRPALWADAEAARAAAEAAAVIADVVVASADDLAVVWNETADAFFDRMAASGVGVTIVTDGPGTVLARTGNELIRVEPPAAQAVDSTGAGDAFFGTFLANHLAGQTVRVAIERAAEVASTVVGTPGALTYLLNR
jgi:2-dehydro-3-deoxygluconokinase